MWDRYAHSLVLLKTSFAIEIAFKTLGNPTYGKQ